MEIRHLKALLAVVHTGSFRRAAKQLGLAQPTVSQLVDALERELGGVKLLERVSGEARPTGAGRRIAQEAEWAVKGFDRVHAVVDGLADERTEMLRVGFSPSHRALAEKAIYALVEENKTLRVFAEQGEARALEEQLTRGQIDVALAFIRKDMPQEVEQQNAVASPLYFIARKEHSLFLELGAEANEENKLLPRHIVAQRQDKLALLRRELRPREVINRYFSHLKDDKANAAFMREFERRVVFETNVVPILLRAVEKFDWLATILPLPDPTVLSKDLGALQLDPIERHQQSAILRRADSRQRLKRTVAEGDDEPSAADMFQKAVGRIRNPPAEESPGKAPKARRKPKGRRN